MPYTFEITHTNENNDSRNMEIDSLSQTGIGGNNRSLRFVFICDISGSMHGYKIQQVNESVAAFSEKFR